MAQGAGPVKGGTLIYLEQQSHTNLYPPAGGFYPNGGVLNQITDKLTDRKSTRLNSSHVRISYAVFCLKKKKKITKDDIESHEVVRSLEAVLRFRVLTVVQRSR